MRYIADLHLHSKYSRAVSGQMEVPEIARWAAIKGITLVGTGDWTHPLWLNELRSQLEEVEEGVYRLNIKYQKSNIKNISDINGGWDLHSKVGERIEDVRFLLTTEISSIYTQEGKQRRIHNLVLAPSFSVVERINNELLARGCNLSSDGRPIIGLSARDLAELVFSVSEDCLLIPTHVWTPWYSLYGSNSGFDSLEDCFGEFSDEVRAIETGLSSDPAMNWRIRELDGRAIVSFSDAHSPRNLGREATVFQYKKSKILPAGRQGKDQKYKEKIKELSYQVLAGAIRRDPASNLEIAYTIEFFPEEGKYHYTGHRNCGVCHSPEETAKLGTICPTCGRKLTVGVMQRVEDLATRKKLKVRSGRLEEEVRSWELGEGNRPPYVMLVPLMEIIAESLGLGKRTKGVEEEYFKLVNYFGSEFNVLLKVPTGKIEKVGGERTAEGVRKVRDGNLHIKPGFDGVFGKVKIWGEEEEEKEREQLALF